ncbi:Hypothetical protein CAP_0306 [Chondromyces apiculatus DSM 436]|uniref:DUF304 domain-containing protein n=1 Tax=Chondromyces apiculatus DSM 436 TaxID=1192034 RepID=A0A017SUS2_9BACT|nr:Hypothetical protein CAP_0306 [Chondromyces apiculatus DSM 436]
MEQELGPDEQLLWAGRPSRGVRFSLADAYLIAFGLVWGVFAVIWEAMLLLFHGPFWFHFVGIPCGIFAVHLLVGRFVVDVLRRARTLYALTDRRAIVIEGGAGGRVVSVALGERLPMELREGFFGWGTIRFGVGPGALQGLSWPGLQGLEPPSFVGIRNVRAVFDLAAEVRRKQLAAPRAPRAPRYAPNNTRRLARQSCVP